MEIECRRIFEEGFKKVKLTEHESINAMMEAVAWEWFENGYRIASSTDQRTDISVNAGGQPERLMGAPSDAPTCAPDRQGEALIAEPPAPNDQPSRCKHGVWAADRCEDCANEHPDWVHDPHWPEQPVELSLDPTHALLKHLKYRRCDDEYYLSREGLAALKGELLAIEIKRIVYAPEREVQQPDERTDLEILGNAIYDAAENFMDRDGFIDDRKGLAKAILAIVPTKREAVDEAEAVEVMLAAWKSLPLWDADCLIANTQDAIDEGYRRSLRVAFSALSERFDIRRRGRDD